MARGENVDGYLGRSSLRDVVEAGIEKKSGVEDLEQGGGKDINRPLLDAEDKGDEGDKEGHASSIIVGKSAVKSKSKKHKGRKYGAL